jgi:PhoH-like ATPase
MHNQETTIVTTPNSISYKILDTNLAVMGPEEVWTSFTPKEGSDKTNILLVPYVVLKELNRFKTERTERGRNAREAVRQLRLLRQEKGGTLHQGIPVNTNYVIKGAFDFEIAMKQQGTDIDFQLEEEGKELADNQLLRLTRFIQQQGKDVELVSNDFLVEETAGFFGLPASRWKDFGVQETYKGWRMIEDAPPEIIEVLRDKDKRITSRVLPHFIEKPQPNEYFCLLSKGKITKSVLARYDAEQESLVRLCKTNGVKAENMHQEFLLDALGNKNITSIFAEGIAGAGKSYLSVAAGLSLLDARQYTYMLLTRPVIPSDKEQDVGFLPGDLDAKLAPWYGCLDDQFVSVAKHRKTSLEKLKDKYHQRIMRQSIIHIKGKNIEDTFWIVDNSEDLTPRTFKALGTRVGQKCKIVFTGDPYQCDRREFHGKNNGLTIVSTRLQKSLYTATIYFDDKEMCVRSNTAKEFNSL